MNRQAEILDGLYDNVLHGHAPATLALTTEALALAMDPRRLLNDALIPALEEVGRLFEAGEYFVPEMLIAARAMHGSIAVLKPSIVASGLQPIGTFVMGTVKGDVHDIGKNLCSIMLEGAGFKLIDLGVNVAPQAFVDAIIEHQPDVVGMSAFLTTTMPMLRTNIALIEKLGLRDKAKILVGGAPVNQAYCDSIGADGYARDANSAVRVTKQLMGLSENKQ